MASDPPATRPRRPQPADSQRPVFRIRRRYLWAALPACLVIVLVASAAAAFFPRFKSMTVIINNEAVSHETNALTVGDALRQLGIQLSASDLVTPPLDTPLIDNAIIHIEHARRVLLRVNGSSSVLFTPLDNPSDILDAEGVEYHENDRLVVDGIEVTLNDLENWSSPALQISVDHAVPITIEVNGIPRQLQTLESAARTVGEAIYEAGIPLYMADIVTPSLDTPLSSGLHILIQPALPISLYVDGSILTTHVRGSTVRDALSQVGILLMGQDFAVPPLDTLLAEAPDIQIVRVKEVFETVLTPIPFEIIYQSDVELPAYERLVMQEGSDGVLVTVYRVRYENGNAVGRELISETVARPPENRLIIYGINSTP